MIVDIVIVLIAVGGIAFAINYFNNNLFSEKNKISIKESIDLTNLPIITLQEGDLKLNFLLDSGSTNSHISESCAETLLGIPVTINEFNYLTSTGKDTVSKMIESVLKYKNKEFKTNLLVNKGLDSAFLEIKKENGVQLHGILGSDFLREHKYTLDFSKLAVYYKK